MAFMLLWFHLFQLNIIMLVVASNNNIHANSLLLVTLSMVYSRDMSRQQWRV